MAAGAAGRGGSREGGNSQPRASKKINFLLKKKKKRWEKLTGRREELGTRSSSFQGIPASTCTSFVFFHRPLSLLAGCECRARYPLWKQTFSRPSRGLGNAAGPHSWPDKRAGEGFWDQGCDGSVFPVRTPPRLSQAKPGLGSRPGFSGIAPWRLWLRSAPRKRWSLGLKIRIFSSFQDIFVLTAFTPSWGEAAPGSAGTACPKIPFPVGSSAQHRGRAPENPWCCCVGPWSAGVAYPRRWKDRDKGIILVPSRGAAGGV